MSKYHIRTLQEKEAIVSHYKQHGWQATAEKYHLSRATFSHWQARLKTAKASDLHPLARRRLIRPETVALVKQIYQKEPGLSLSQIQQKVSKKQSISKTTIWHIIQGR